MDIRDDASEAAFRAELRRWLEKTLPQLDGPEPWDLDERLPWWRKWQRLLLAGGYAGLGWPEEYGGAGMGALAQAIFSEECDRVGVPQRLNIIGEDFAGPTIMSLGSAQQKERFLPRILSGEDIWCQLFSEPEAGSDLASLRTRADRVEGGFRVNGQKLWTSRAQIAANAILLARTGGGERHRGITFFLLPMATGGITVRPLPQMLGETEFNEVFFDDVLIPDELVVGEVDGGWPVAMATLGFERVAIATGRVNTELAIQDIIAEVKASGRGGDPLIRQRVADLYGRALMHRATAQRTLRAKADAPPGPESSIAKLFFCPLVEDLADFALSLQDLGGQVEGESGHVRWLRLAYQARGTSIAGGTTFIQRNIVAQRVLGMPRNR